jgi:hypothetical protein
MGLPGLFLLQEAADGNCSEDLRYAAKTHRKAVPGRANSACETGECIGTNACGHDADNGRLRPIRHEQAQHSIAAPSRTIWEQPRRLPPTLQGPSSPLVGTLATVIPLIPAGIGATGGWGSLKAFKRAAPMSYLKNFRHDIFFSYAHGPESDVSVSAEEGRYLQRWTQHLAKDVVQHINFYLQQKDPKALIKGWIDRSLIRTLPVDTTLKNEVQSSAIFFCVMTNYYLASSYCLSEIDWFKDTYADEGENKQRIFVVRATRTSRDRWPHALTSSSGSTVDGYKFYENTEADQEFFDPFGWPVPQLSDDKYWKAVRAIALDAAKMLWALKKAENTVHVIAASSPAGQKIFLGYMHDTLSTEREEIRGKLQELGFSVVPDAGNDPYDRASLDNALASIGECRAAVLVANEYCGRWPHTEPGGFVSYQVNAFRKANIPAHLWIKVQEIEHAQTEDYQNYLRRLLQEGGLHFSNVLEFCHSFAQIRSSIAGIEFAVLVTNRPSDEKQYTEFQEAVTSAISESGRLILTSNLSSSSEPIKLIDLESCLNDADTLAIICFDQKWGWASRLMGQLRQLRRNKNNKRRQLFVTGPVVSQPLSLDARTLSFDTIEGAQVALPALKNIICQKLLTPVAGGNS